MAHIIISSGKSMLLSFGALMIIAPAQAQTSPAPSATPVIDQLYACRTIADAAQRLICFDSAAAAVQTADEAHEIRIIDRETETATRRGLFGFSLGNLNPFARRGQRSQNAPAQEEIVEIDAVIASVGRTRDGDYLLTLDNGQRWAQVDTRTIYGTPRSGERVHIRRGALGSYFLSVTGRPGFRVERRQ